MGPSDKSLYIVGSALAALLLIVGFKSFLEIKGGHHDGQPEAGYSLPMPDAEEKAAAPAPATSEATAPADASKPAPADAAAAAAPATPAVAAPAPAAAPAAADTGDIAALIAAADVNKGKKLFRRCGSCHSSKKGEPPALGPNLYGVVGRDIGSEAAFTGYSTALKEKPGNWTLESLSAFIASPKKAVPGTRMIFSGIKNDKKRANLLAYIKTLSD